MRKRIVFAIMCLIVFGMLTGCGKKTLTKESDPKEVLQEAAGLYDKKDVRGSEVERRYYYDNGTEEYENSVILFDTVKEIRQEKIIYEMGFSYLTYNTKEDGEYFVYIQNGDSENDWIKYKEEAEASETNYEQLKSGFDFIYSEEDGYKNIEYTNEGREKIEGIQTIKIKITAELSFFDDSEEVVNEVTREDILSEYGWSEEEVSLVEGFSEVLDQYVIAMNGENSQNHIQYEQNVWIDVETHELVQVQKKTIYIDEDSANAVENEKAINTFENMSWQMDMVHNDLEAGLPKEEILLMLEEAREALDDAEYYEEEFEGIPNQTKEIETERFLLEEDFPELKDLPEKYEEITEEEYYELAF